MEKPVTVRTPKPLYRELVHNLVSLDHLVERMTDDQETSDEDCASIREARRLVAVITSNALTAQ